MGAVMLAPAVAPMELDRFAPIYQFRESHSLKMRATPAHARRAIKEVTADEIFLFHTLIWLRRFGRTGPESVLNVPRATPLLEVATRTTFLTLADGAREIVVGTVVGAPRNGPRPRPASADELLALQGKAGYAIATMNFAIHDQGDGTCVVSTETRVNATHGAARRHFAAYWRVIHPGSALIRRMWLRAIRRRAEAMGIIT